MPDSKRSCLIVVLAAGEGRRMASSLPKVLHPVAGLPMLVHVLKTSKMAGSTACAVVVGNQAQLVADAATGFEPDAQIFVQTERKGTAHAVLTARDALECDVDDVVVLYGDVPLIKAETISATRQVLAEGSDVVVLGFNTNDPTGYGRLIVKNGALTAIREHKDITDEEKDVSFCNSGIIAFRGESILPILDGIGCENSQNEFYLTDAVEIANSRGLKTTAIEVSEDETLGVNDRIQLAQIEEIWQNWRRQQAMTEGVTITQPMSVVFHHDTVVETGVTLEPNIVFAEGVTIRKGATIRSFSHLEGCTIGNDAVIGPYARLRPGTEVEKGAKIGNFVETKNTQVREGAKINHLSYIGDSEVGAKANIGAGTITCNYDGFGKHQTIIGAGAFVGTNTSLVAPVRIGVNANTAAGSVIYVDVPDDALAIERTNQANLVGKAKSLRERNRTRKEAAPKK